MLYEDDDDEPCGNCGEEAEEYPTYRAAYPGGIIVRAGSVWLCYDCAKRAGKER